MATRDLFRLGLVSVVALVLTTIAASTCTAADWFGPAQSTPIDGSPRHVTQGHFNADGALDWAVVCDEQTLWVGLNDGTGAFELRGPFSTPTFPWKVAAGDLTGDGLDDLALIRQGGDGLFLYRNLGGGTMQDPPEEIPALFAHLSLDVEDLDLDGRSDVAVGTYASVSVYWGNGNGVGSIPTTSSASLNFDEWCLDDLTNIWDLEIADATDDGLPDIVLAASHDGEQLCETVFRRGLGYVESLGARQLAPEAEWIVQEPQAVSREFYDLDVFDLDGNGQLDVSVAPDGSPHRYYFHVGDTWQQCPQFVSGGGRRSTVLHDWDGDGWGDAATAQPGSFAIGRGAGLTGFGLIGTVYSGLGSPTTGQFDLLPGSDLLGHGTGVVNLYSNLISPVGILEGEPAGQGLGALRVEPSVIGPGVVLVRLRLGSGRGGAFERGERMLLRVFDHAGRMVWSESLAAAIDDGGLEWPLGDVPNLASGIYRVTVTTRKGSLAGSLVILR